MVRYPIYVRRKHYRGSKEAVRRKTAEQNRIAAELERHVNAKIKDQKEPVTIYLYYEIARDTGYDLETVRKFLFGVDCGHNGFTVMREDVELDSLDQRAP